MTTVITFGTFDVLHVGHVRVLKMPEGQPLLHRSTAVVTQSSGSLASHTSDTPRKISRWVHAEEAQRPEGACPCGRRS